MSIDFSINAEMRADTGKGASRRLRHAGLTPAIVYGGSEAPVAITLKHDEIIQHIGHEAFFSHILDLKLDGRTQKVVLRDMQRHPARRMVMHLDFQRIAERDRIHMHVPLHFMGEDAAPGIKAGGVVSHLTIEVEITCLPKDLPEYIEVDMSGLEIGESIHLSDIRLPEGVTLVGLTQGEGHDSAVAAIHAPRAQIEEEEEQQEVTDEDDKAEDE